MHKAEAALVKCISAVSQNSSDRFCTGFAIVTSFKAYEWVIFITLMSKLQTAHLADPHHICVLDKSNEDIRSIKGCVEDIYNTDMYHCRV